MKPIDDSKLINEQTTKELIEDLFSYLSYLYLIFVLYKLQYLDFCQLKSDCLYLLSLTPTI